MNTHEINITFETEEQFSEWREANFRKHADGIRSTYNGEIVWAVNLEQEVDPRTMKRGPLKLRSIDTWRNK